MEDKDRTSRKNHSHKHKIDERHSKKNKRRDSEDLKSNSRSKSNDLKTRNNKERDRKSVESKSSSTQSRRNLKLNCLTDFRDKKHRKEKKKHHSKSRKSSHSKKQKSRMHRSRSRKSSKNDRHERHSNKKSHSKRKSDNHKSRSPRRSNSEDREKRSRTRSPAPQMRKFKIQQPLSDSLYGVQKKFWDGFQWIVRTNSVPNDQNALNQTRKMRRISVSNLPLYYGITDKDVATILSQFMISNYLADAGNKTPVLAVQINNQAMTALIELSSVEETNRIVKVDSIRIFNHNCKITRVGENLYGSSFNLANLVTNAQTSAQAQAAALAAMEMVQKSDKKQLLKTSITPPSQIIKATNIVDPAKAQVIPLEELMRLEESVVEEFGKFGKILDGFLIKPFQVGIGAELGACFIEFETMEEAENAMSEMFSKKLNDREIKMIFIPKDVYEVNFKPLALKFQNN